MKELTNKLQERIIKILMKRYPITTDEIVNEIRMRKDVVQNEIKKLESEGVIALEILSDKIFVRLLKDTLCFLPKKKLTGT